MYVRATHELVLRALTFAKADRIDSANTFVFHADWGTQYTSGKVTAWLSANGGVPSIGPTGSSADNASAESFFGVLKWEIDYVIRQTTRAEATMRINDYLVNLHNVRRSNSDPTLGRAEKHSINKL